MYSVRVDSDDHAFSAGGFINHNTECRLAPLAMQLLAGIDEDTVDFIDTYDGKTQEPAVLPARFPNLLVNGSGGIAVGMATNIPPHNLREVIDATVHLIDNPEATSDDLMQFVLGPDFPTGALIMGRSGILDAYRTGRGSIRMRAVAEIEEDAKGGAADHRHRGAVPDARSSRSAPRSRSWSGSGASRASATPATRAPGPAPASSST